MNRVELQTLADMRVKDAEVLVDAHCWAAAYYLLGYAVECALKACAAGRFHEHEVPDKKFVQDFYTHRLDELLNLSGIKTDKDKRAKKERGFAVNWITVCEWHEGSRYDLTTNEDKARGMYIAVTDPKCGVLTWLKTVWSRNSSPNP